MRNVRRAESAISIHAPRTGSDAHALGGAVQRFHFNPRSPHGERRQTRERAVAKKDFNPRSPHGERQAAERLGLKLKKFQSTLPARGATGLSEAYQRMEAISIHAPRTGSDSYWRCSAVCGLVFQSTLPARGATNQQQHRRNERHPFQSTLPARGATHIIIIFCHIQRISIHAPRTGSDGTL